MAMSTVETIRAFSEWLDSEGIIYDGDDDRTHDDLAREFIRGWEAQPGAATLAGRPHRGISIHVDEPPRPGHADHAVRETQARISGPYPRG